MGTWAGSSLGLSDPGSLTGPHAAAAHLGPRLLLPRLSVFSEFCLVPVSESFWIDVVNEVVCFIPFWGWTWSYPRR